MLYEPTAIGDSNIDGIDHWMMSWVPGNAFGAAIPLDGMEFKLIEYMFGNQWKLTWDGTNRNGNDVSINCGRSHHFQLDDKNDVIHWLYLFIRLDQFNDLVRDTLSWADFASYAISCVTVEGSNPMIDFVFSANPPTPSECHWDYTGYQPIRMEFTIEDISKFDNNVYELQLTIACQGVNSDKSYTFPISVRRVDEIVYEIYQPGDTENNRQWYVIDRIAGWLEHDTDSGVHNWINVYARKG
jgi:hypothetical protein